jgi:hypothetical protein
MKIQFWPFHKRLPIDKIEAFAEELFHTGVRVLACGGGVTAHPVEAISKLTKKYTPQQLIRLSMELVFETPLDKEFPEGAAWVAEGIIYHLADKDLLQELKSMREQLINKKIERRLEDIEELIAGICGRLELPYPEGIEALDPQIETYLFLSE